jgi:hypothetical protein
MSISIMLIPMQTGHSPILHDRSHTIILVSNYRRAQDDFQSDNNKNGYHFENLFLVLIVSGI